MKDASFWVEKSLNLTRRKGELEHALAGIEAEAAALMLDAEDETGGANTRGSLDMVERVQAEIRALDGAIRVCRARRLDAIKAKRQSEVAELRKQAEQLRDQLEKLESKTAKHLAAISELQQMPYSATPALAHSPWGTVPLSQRLQNEITAAEQKAAGLECEVPRHGTVTLDNVTAVDPLIAAVLHHASDSPSSQDVVQWAADVERKAGRGPFGENLRRYTLVWKDGRIDSTESYIQVHSLARSPAGPVSGALGYEIGSDIFRAAAVA